VIPVLFINRGHLPLLAEQKRIVTKVDRLMARCDELKEKIVSFQVQSQKLLRSVVHGFLAE